MEHDDLVSAAQDAPDRLVIAGWSLQEERHCLVRDMELVKLEPKATHLLAYMARHAGEPLTREVLLAEVWRGVVVGDEALTTAINKIRRAFGDDRQNPHVIETIPKMGYRLIAPVSRNMPDEPGQRGCPKPDLKETPDSAATAVRGAHPWWVRTRARLAMGLLMASGLVIGVLTAIQPTEKAVVVQAPSQGPVPTVTIFPFDVLGDDPEQQYLARGLTADLIAQLSRLSGINVTAASTAGGPPGANADSSLEKRYEVWGGVRRDSDQLKIELHLIEAVSGRQLWVERYERLFGDLFEIQDEIGTRLAQALSIRVTEVEQARLAHRYTRSVAAYDLFLRAQSELLVRRKENNERAKDLYLQSVALDPSFARAYGGLALIYAGDYRNQWAVDREKALAQALEFANTAVEIDPMLPEIHWVLGYVKTQQRRHAEALAHLDQALNLRPGFADALALKGGIKTYIGKPADTVPLLRSAIRQNPAAGYLYFMTLGRAYFFLGDQLLAVINLREAVKRNPAILEVRVYLAAALELKGDHEDAQWEAVEVRAIDPDFSARVWLETYPIVDSRLDEKLIAALKRLGL